GHSGAGKSVALRCLEDIGYYCVDNLPLDLLPQLASILSTNQQSVAISLDIRNLPHSSKTLENLFTEVQQQHQIKLIFWMLTEARLFVATVTRGVYIRCPLKIFPWKLRLMQKENI
ncbi:hypothetical protein AAUPMC_01867, partial [Pasteurella multocida subsp. multocida str. Anand1_cattle]